MTDGFSEKTKGVLALIGLTIAWALVALLPRYLATSFQLFQQLYLRFLVGSFFTCLIFIKKINFQKILNPTTALIPLFARAVSYYLLGVALFTQAILTTKISNVSFIGTLPVTALLGVIVFKEKLTLKKALLVSMAFLGVILISVKEYNHLLTFKTGELLALLSNLFVSFGMLIRRWESNKFNTHESSFIVLFLATVIIFITSLMAGEGLPTTNWTLHVILALLLAGLLNAVIVLLVSYGFKRVKPVLASNLLQLESPWIIILAFLFFRELPNLKEAFGGLIILSSVYLMNRLENKNTT